MSESLLQHESSYKPQPKARLAEPLPNDNNDMLAIDKLLAKTAPKKRKSNASNNKSPKSKSTKTIITCIIQKDYNKNISVF